MNFSITWHLDPLELHLIEAFRRDFALCMQALESDFSKGVVLWQKLHRDSRQIQSHAACLSVEDITNPQGIQESAVSLELEGLVHEAACALDEKLVQLTEKEIEDLIQDKEIHYYLFQRRALAQKRLSKKQETLIAKLQVHGFHSLNELYKIAYERMRIEVEGKRYSPGQIDNLFHSPLHELRKKAFLALTDNCKEQEEIFAQILRSITGFRLDLNKERGWENPFFEPYHNNRCEEKTVLAMWQAISQHKTLFVKFLKKKQTLLGADQLCWYDIEAPIQSNTDAISYQDACTRIIEAFSGYSQDLASFAKHALKSGWCDVENRQNKAYGGFCTPFPNTKESRIFLNYSESMHNMLVLAHELGHAYHNHVLYDFAECAQLYPITLAETASTTCELLLLQLLAKKGQASVWHDICMRCCTFFLNIQARFLFEKMLFTEAKKGFVSSKMLSDMMLEAQKNAFSDALDIYHPYFWITKIHFYLTDYPSYNFPYTVGFCLSLALVKRALENPETFEQLYRAFLQDSGKMSVEAIVKKHFEQDATTVDFWLEAIQPAIDAFEQFVGDK